MSAKVMKEKLPEGLKKVDNFPELGALRFYIGLNTNKVPKNEELYAKCEKLIKDEHKNTDDKIRKSINRLASKENTDGATSVLLNHLTNVLYSTIGLGVKKMACKCKNESQKDNPKQKGGAWNEDGVWEGDDKPNYSMATYENVMTMVATVRDSQAVQLANEYLDELPVPFTTDDEEDGTIVRTGKKVGNLIPYIVFSYSCFNIYIYLTWIFRMLNTDLLGLTDTDDLYEFQAPPQLLELTDGESDDREMSNSLVAYDAKEIWDPNMYPKTDMIEKITTLDLILNTNDARNTYQLYLGVAGEIAQERVLKDMKEMGIEKAKQVAEDTGEQYQKIQERREQAYSPDKDWVEYFRYHIDKSSRWMNFKGNVDDGMTALSRSVEKQQLETEFQWRKAAQEIKWEITDKIRIHTESTFNAANNVYWSLAYVAVFGLSLFYYIREKRRAAREAKREVNFEIRLQPRQTSDRERAQQDGTFPLIYEFNRQGDNFTWTAIPRTRSGRPFPQPSDTPEDRYGCPIPTCTTMGGKRRKKRKTRRKKRRKTRRKSKKRKSKRRRRKRKKTRRKRR